MSVDKLLSNGSNKSNKKTKKITNIHDLTNEEEQNKHEVNIVKYNHNNNMIIQHQHLDLITDKVNKTKMHCWWCDHQFNNYPCFIPTKYYKKTYYVYGCFCSFNCAMAY